MSAWQAWGSVWEGSSMENTAVYRYGNTAVLSVTAVDAPITVTSRQFDDALAGTYDRLGLRPGMLENLAGISERRWWTPDVSFADAAAMAGAKALAEAGIRADQVGLLINTSVCRDRLEPSIAVDVHAQLGIGPGCLNFDVANACLGFINGMQLAAMMIDAGQVEYALIVDGEGSRYTQERTIERLQKATTTKLDILNNFATLTLGSGGAAMVLGRADAHSAGHPFVGGVSRAATHYNTLCVGDLDGMSTDSRGLLEAGVELARDTWTDASKHFEWSDLTQYVIHQVSKLHTAAISEALGIDQDRVPLTFPTRGNIGPASVPFTLAKIAGDLMPGDRIACMGIGSGLNAAVIEIVW